MVPIHTYKSGAAGDKVLEYIPIKVVHEKGEVRFEQKTDSRENLRHRGGGERVLHLMAVFSASAVLTRLIICPWTLYTYGPLPGMGPASFVLHRLAKEMWLLMCLTCSLKSRCCAPDSPVPVSMSLNSGGMVGAGLRMTRPCWQQILYVTWFNGWFKSSLLRSNLK